jgi:hypothetical protein
LILLLALEAFTSANLWQKEARYKDFFQLPFSFLQSIEISTVSSLNLIAGKGKWMLSM